MTTYVYRCPEHGAFDVRRPLGQASPTEACPGCDAASHRVFTAPRLTRLSAPVAAAVDAAASTAEAPPVVTSLPGRGGPAGVRPLPHPATARLPRP